MKSRCWSCGREYEVEPTIADGQEVFCPFCDTVAVYHKPTRIEIPADARRARQNADGMQPVSRFHVIRPNASTSSSPGTSGGNAMVDRVTARARAEARRQILKKIGTVLKDLFWILVLVVLVFGGWRIFLNWRKPERILLQPQTAEQPSKVVPPEEPAVPSAAKPSVRPAENVPSRRADASSAVIVSKTCNPPLTADEEFCASRVCFGADANGDRSSGLRTDNLYFDILLVMGERGKPIKVATTRFGEKTPNSAFRAAAEPFARMVRAHERPRPEPAVYRRTVVFHGGQVIGVNAEGVTKVPRKPQFTQGPEYLRWLKLSEEAKRQDLEYRRIQAENETKLRAWERQMGVLLSDEEIRKALMAATVRITCREGGEK